MGLNLKNKKTWWYVSPENMMCNRHIDGYEGLWSQGVHDSIEQTYHAYFAYDDYRFIKGIKDCWKRIEYKNPIMRKLFGFKYKPQRYPIAYDAMKGMSRDHVIYSLVAFKYSGMSDKEVWEYVKRIPFFIGDNIGTTMTPKLWLWGRLISGKLIGLLYYPLALFSALRVNLTTRFLNWLFDYRYGEEIHQSKYDETYSDIFTEAEKKFIKFYYPTYAVKLSANMLKVLPDNIFTRITKNLLKPLIPKYNYVLKLLLGVDLSQEEREDLRNYRPMTGDRWSDQLNNSYPGGRLHIIEDYFGDPTLVKENTLDKDYALKLLKYET